jgi:hypothetical protein
MQVNPETSYLAISSRNSPFLCKPKVQSPVSEAQHQVSSWFSWIPVHTGTAHFFKAHFIILSAHLSLHQPSCPLLFDVSLKACYKSERSYPPATISHIRSYITCYKKKAHLLRIWISSVRVKTESRAEVKSEPKPKTHYNACDCPIYSPTITWNKYLQYFKEKRLLQQISGLLFHPSRCTTPPRQDYYTSASAHYDVCPSSLHSTCVGPH